MRDPGTPNDLGMIVVIALALLVGIVVMMTSGCSHGFHGMAEDLHGYSGALVEGTAPAHYKSMERDTTRNLTISERHVSILERMQGIKKP